MKIQAGRGLVVLTQTILTSPPSALGSSVVNDQCIAGVDTPEMRDKCPLEKELAIKARAFTKNALINAKVIELRNLRRDKYFRLLADVCLGGQSLSDQLIKAGLGYVYEGGTKKVWCE